MSINRNLLITNLIISSFATQIQAEEIQPIIVSATRSAQTEVTTPASITIITREDIAQSGAQHISEVLRTKAGLQLRDLYGDGSRTTISMRGFSGGNAAANTLVLVDGRRLNNIDLAGPQLNSISLKDVVRIEIIQGSAGTLFGDQAVGGVINIITRMTGEPWAEVEAGIGSYKKRRLTAQLSDTITEKLSFRLNAEALNTDNYRKHNKKDYLNGFARFDYAVTDGNWFAELQTIDEELELPGALTVAQLATDRRQANPSFPDDFNDTKTRIARIGTRKLFSPNLQVEAELTYRNEDIVGIGYATSFAQNRQSKGFTPRLISNWSTKHGEALLTVGLDYEDNDYEYDSSVGYISDVNATQSNWAMYTQLVYPLTQSLSGTIGLRYAEVDNHIVDSSYYPAGLSLKDDVSVAEFGLSWQFSSAWRLFTRLDENYRFAKIDEQTYTSPGNLGLNTQTGTSYELGTEWRTNQYQAKILAYRLDLDNEIDFDSTAPSPGFFPGANVNLPPTRRNGLILEGKARLTDLLSLSGQITKIDATITSGSFAGNTIPFVSEYESSLTLNFQQSKALSWFVEAHYTGKRFQDSDYNNTQTKLPSFTAFNIHVRYIKEKWDSGLRINNVLNKEYIGYATFNSYYPAPERNFEIYTNYQF